MSKKLAKSKTPKKSHTLNGIKKLLCWYSEEVAYPTMPDFYEGSEEFPGCCGISVISGLRTATALQQAASILAVFDREKVSQVVFTDTLRSKKWVSAKEVAIRGPITRNPKTKNQICFYVITESELDELITLIPDRDLLKLEEEQLIDCNY